MRRAPGAASRNSASSLVMLSILTRCRSSLAQMGADAGQTPAMPTALLGANGPVVSRIGLGLAALGRPAYITSDRDAELPDRSPTGMRARTYEVLDAAYAAGVRYADAARSYGRAEEV